MICFNKALWGCSLFVLCHFSVFSIVSMPVRATVERVDSIPTRPDHVNNAESRYFPPVFNQDGGSCGSASRIGYMFTHEINAFPL